MISQYSQQSDELTRLVADCSGDCSAWKRDEIRWSTPEIAGHLADAKLLASMRIPRIIAQDRPWLTGCAPGNVGRGVEIQEPKDSRGRAAIFSVAQRHGQIP